MAENDTGEKTEKPTARRTGQARTEGQIVRSVELSQVLGLSAAFIGIQYLAPRLWSDMLVVTRGGLSGGISSGDFSIEGLRHNFYGLVLLILPDILMLLGIAALFGAGSTAIQTKFNWSTKLIKPKWPNISPLAGIKRIFSIHNFINILKSLAKLSIILPIAYFAFLESFPQIMQLMHTPLSFLFPFTGTAMSLVFWRIIRLLFILALFDYGWQYYSVNKKLKMTKVEVKDEHKSVEGDEATKMSIRSKGLARARERMMLAVKTADVVVTNPTHYAIALKYDLAVSKAPMVVAKGRNYMAERIKEVARQARVPVIERKPLARALFATVEIGQEIPYELYAAVADLLAYVYKITGKNPLKKRPQTSQKNKDRSRA